MPDSFGNMTILRAAAENLTDAQRMRIAVENRAERGGAAIDSIAKDRLIRNARGAEEEAKQLLLAVYQEEIPEPIRDWAKSVPGLGSGPLFPRIAGLIGNPLIATPYRWETPEGGKRVLVADGEPYQRSLRTLWQWCGIGDPEKRPKAGMSQAELMACGRRTIVRPLLYTFSSYIGRTGRVVTKEGSAKFGQPMSQDVADSRYFKVFEQAKAEGLEKRHQDTCRNHKRPPAKPNGCGTVAHPEWGEPGSQWRPAHAEAHAHRLVGKELLRDYWAMSLNLGL